MTLHEISEAIYFLEFIDWDKIENISDNACRNISNWPCLPVIVRVLRLHNVLKMFIDHLY